MIQRSCSSPTSTELLLLLHNFTKTTETGFEIKEIALIETWASPPGILRLISLSLSQMIVARPKINTLLSIGIFIALCFGISGYMLSLILESGRTVWYQYALVIVPGPLALGLLTKTLLGYKRVEIGKNRIGIQFPLRFKKVSFTLKEVKQWTEQKVKTAGGTFKELVILFDNGKKLTLSLQEHTNYLDAVKYLRKKCARKYIER